MATLMGRGATLLGLAQNVTASGETNLLSTSISPNVLFTDGAWIDAYASGYTEANAGLKTIRMRFGGEILATITGALNNVPWGFNLRITRNSVGGQFITGTYGSGDGAIFPVKWAHNFTTRDLSVANTLLVTGDGPLNGDVTQRVLEWAVAT